VRRLTLEAGGLLPLVELASRLADLCRYSGVREVDGSALQPLLVEVFRLAAWSAPVGCLCGTEDLGAVSAAILQLQRVSFGIEGALDVSLWHRMLERIALEDSFPPYLSGLAFGLVRPILRLSPQSLEEALTRRLSPRLPPAVLLAWLKGLLSHNRELLFATPLFWASLNAYLAGLDDASFRSVLLPLHAAFVDFSPGQVARAATVIGGIVGRPIEEVAAEAAQQRLSDEEAIRLQEELGDLGI
jgi:hypothetical protein